MTNPWDVDYSGSTEPSENPDRLKDGVKYDSGKPRYDLLPPELDRSVSTILAYGANKYAARNWEKGMEWGRVYGALRRHLDAFWGGEDIDPESGYPHLWHAACNIAFLVAYRERGIGNDDRSIPQSKGS